MEGWYHVNLRCYTMSLWSLVVVLLMLPQYSESVCNVANCKSSSQCNGKTCLGCNDGYHLQSESCVQCQQSLPGCATCSSSTSCTKCNDGYYLQSGSCKPCPDRCPTYTSSTQCKTCKDTYWNDNNNGCSSYCSDNCLDRRCNDTTGYCYSCIPGKYGQYCEQDFNLCKDGQCNPCKFTNGCKDGYYQENTASGYSFCWKCVYDNCLTCSNVTYCTQCEQGYYRNYYRQSSGRGIINCLQCYDSCLDCTSTEHCHEDCIKHCSEPVKPGTTKSTYESTSGPSKCSSSNTKPPTETQKVIESIKSTESTPHGDLYKELNSCQQQIKTCSESKDQLTFGHGLATGISITIVLFGSVVGIALFIKRQTKQHKHADIWSVMLSENNKVTNDIHTVSSDLTNTAVTNIDSSRDYVMLGDRPTHESNYTDLQTT